MKKVNVNIAKQEDQYEILIGEGLLDELSELFDFQKYSALFVISDSNVAELYLDKLTKALPQKKITSYVFPSGEESKKLQTIQVIYTKMLEAGIDRKALVINLGGGVVTDMGGFAASTYLRGIPFINIATTLEGMVDASVGGKTGVNFNGYKNYVGTFTQPKKIIMSVDVLKTLSKREFIAAFAEIIKHGLIVDKNYFELATGQTAADFDLTELATLIEGSCRIKRDIVEADVREELGKRKLLNFGHTIGHALETHSFKTSRLLHGEAVAIGMVAEAKISELMGMLSANTFQEIQTKIKQAGLSVSLPVDDIDAIMQLIQQDKKVEARSVKWTLLKDIGEGIFNVDVEDNIVKRAIEFVCRENV